MDSLTPSWLDDNFLTQVLQSAEDSVQAVEVEVIKYRCQHAVPPGTNYLSQMFRISVDYKTDKVKTTSLIVKTPLESGFGREMLEMSSGYKKEIKIYNEILPKMYALLSVKISAKPYFCPLENSLVLEDLKESGYKMADRLQQLDFAHCQYFLESLARLHALSVVIQESHPELLKEFRHWLYNSEAPEEVQKIMKEKTITMIKKWADAIKEVDGCERYVGMIHEVADNYFDKILEISRPGDGLVVLNHGDTWTNNIMFKYDDSGDVVDAKLVDFQVCNLGSFALDIILFWWTSANEEVRIHHRAELFEVYRQTLNRNLSELNCRKFLSKEEFDLEMKSKAPYAISVVHGLLGVAMADPHKLEHFSSIESEDLFMYSFTKNFRSKYYVRVLPAIFQEIEELGAFQ
uniref:CHK kinase-like domain-containing protein n=1 Tax=Graphocephala atropunctata TaxID=36148 RepID=A0A1B6LX07_9HEMI